MFERTPTERDTKSVARLFARRWPLVLLIAFVAGGAAYLNGKRQHEKYTATTAVLFQNSAVEQIFFGVTNSGISDPTQQLATNMSLVELPGVAAAVGSRLHLSAADVQSEMSFSAAASSDVISVSATDESPTFAARLANTYVQEYVASRESAVRAEYTQAQQVLATELAAVPAADRSAQANETLAQQSAELKLLATVDTGGAQLVQPAAVPSSPSAPKPTKDALLGLVLGLLVGVALVLALGWRDRRIRSPREAEEIFGVPVLGEVPFHPEKGRRARSHEIALEECFSMIRAQLRYTRTDRSTQRVLVTSAEPQAGRSFVALNLAWATACAGAKSLLIEADLRHPSLGNVITDRRAMGLGELLAESSPEPDFRDMLVSRDGPRSGGSSHGRSDVLLAGARSTNPVELLESEGMAHLLQSSAEGYELVIVDAPAMGAVSDALGLAVQVDAVIVVSRLGHSTRDDAMRLAAQLRELRVPVLGLVVNAGPRRTGYPGGVRPLKPVPVRRVSRSRSGASATLPPDSVVESTERPRGGRRDVQRVGLDG